MFLLVDVVCLFFVVVFTGSGLPPLICCTAISSGLNFCCYVCIGYFSDGD